MKGTILSANRSWFLGLLVAALIVIGGCGDNTGTGLLNATEEPQGTASIALKMSATTASELSRVEVVVTGADMADIEQDLTFDGTVATGVITVPAGVDRLFTLNGYDLEGELVYSGEDQADVVAGEEIVVEITMRQTTGENVGPGLSGSTPIVLQGDGNQVTERFMLVAQTLYVLRVEKQQDSYFIVHLIDTDTGDTVDYLVNESAGETDVSTAFNVETTKEYLLEVSNARGAWTITIDRQ